MVCNILDNVFHSAKAGSSLRILFIINTLERLWPPPKDGSLTNVTANGGGELQYKPASSNAPIKGPIHLPTPASFNGVVPCSFTLTAADGSTSLKKENVTVQIAAPLIAEPVGSYIISFVSVENIVQAPYRDLLFGSFKPSSCTDHAELGDPLPTVYGLLNGSFQSPVTLYIIPQ
jgi:hypothetical protein